MSEDRPWEDYADPVATPTSTSAGQPHQGETNVGYGEDIGKGFVGGVGRGTAGALGIGGTVGGLIRSGLGYAGVPEDYLNKGAAVMRAVGNVVPQARILTGPDASQVQQGIESVTGKFYEPKTVPGQYASTVGEFAPAALIPGGGGLAARAVNTVVPALASETAGQLTKGTAAEPYARAVAGLAAGPAAGKLITPMAPASSARLADVATLEREGIPLTAGQRTGSKSLQWMEANAADMPFSAGKAQEMTANQAGAFDRAVTGHMFDPAELRARGVPEGVNLPDPRVVNAGKQSLSDEYTRLAQANQMRSDPQLQRDLLAAQTKYETNVLPSQRTKDVEKLRNDIVDQLIAGQGAIPGDVYQANRSRLGTLARGQTTDPYAAGAFKDLRSALDQAMARGLSPTDAEAWARNNLRYANMKQLTPAIARAGENLSPQAVAQTARTGRAGQYAAQAGDLDPLAKAASQVIKPMPQSGTAARLGWQKLFNVPAMVAGGGGAAAGSFFGPLGTAVGAVAPFVASRLALSRPGQAYLGNQVLPQNMRDIVAQAVMQQAISQPSGITRNQTEQADYERKRKEELRRQGLQ